MLNVICRSDLFGFRDKTLDFKFGFFIEQTLLCFLEFSDAHTVDFHYKSTSLICNS